MYFDVINEEKVNSSELLALIERNNVKAKTLREQINRLKVNPVTDVFDLSVIDDTKSEDNFNDESLEEEEFEDEVEYFLEGYRLLDRDFSRDDLLAVLPSRKSYYFKKIIIRFQAEAMKEIKDINDFINEEKDSIDNSELEEFRREIEQIDKKKRLLKEVLLEKEEDTLEVESVHNKIVLVPTLAGNIIIIDDIEHIPNEFYASFLELINSIIDGTFKGVKRFSGNYLNGFCEVRGYQVRVIFSRLDKNCYALITAFIKKTDNNREYQEFLKNKVWEFRGIEDSLKTKISSSEFMGINDFYVEELFNILGSGTKNKGYKKGGLND
ncbi:MAG: hypothetical protein HFE81_03795 [Bacilli bacterium]|nr:hypothetical protein [Bacilli bacterium]